MLALLGAARTLPAARDRVERRVRRDAVARERVARRRRGGILHLRCSLAALGLGAAAWLSPGYALRQAEPRGAPIGSRLTCGEQRVRARVRASRYCSLEQGANDLYQTSSSNADEDDLVERSQKEAAIEKKIMQQSTTKKKSGGGGNAQSKGSSGNGKPDGKKTSPPGASNRGNGNAATNRGRGARGKSKKGGGRGAR